MLRSALVLALAALSTLACDAEPAQAAGSSPTAEPLALDDRSRAVIREHLELLELDGLAERYLESVISGIESAPNVPEGLVERIRALAAAEPVDEILLQFIAARIDLETLEAANAFFSTPLGRDYALKQPGLVQGSNDFVRTWATQISIQASNEGLKSELGKGK